MSLVGIISNLPQKTCNKWIEEMVKCIQEDSLVEFKKNIGFKRIDIPRYYDPISIFGRIALTLNLHHGIKNLFPVFILKLLYKIRILKNSLNIFLPKNFDN